MATNSSIKQFSSITDASHQQAQAADPEANVFVAASAGTGKTKVLTDRYLRLLLAGNPAASILCITYTKAAAHEMLTRIKARLRDWFLAEDKALEQSLQQLIFRPPSTAEMLAAKKLYFELLEQEPQLKIQTLHAFCLNLLRQHPPNDKMRSGINVISEEQHKLFLQTAYKKTLLNDEISMNAALQLAEIFDSQTLQKKISELFKPTARLRRFLDDFADEQAFAKIYQEYGATQGTSAQSLTITQITTLQKMPLSDCLNIKGGELISYWLKMPLPEQLEKFNELCLLFLTQEDEPRKLLTKHPQAGNIALSLAEYKANWKAQSAAEYFISLLQIAKAVLNEYNKLCQAYGVFEYEDLIVETISLLSTSANAHWILYQLDMKINHVLIDEAQDISLHQWQIITLLIDDFFAGLSARTQNRTIFIVGDYKQSIYGFQGASPDHFAAIREVYAQKVSDAGKIWREVKLNTSFRSVDPILSFIDATFNQNELQLDFNQQQLKHLAFRNGQGLVTIHPITEIKAAESVEEWHSPQPNAQPQDERKQQVARGIAENIQRWLSESRILPNHARPLQPADILILMRKRSDLQQLIIQELKAKNIPVMDADRFNLNTHLLVCDFVALFNFILLPEDDMNLAILLKSPILQLNEQELYNLAYGRQHSLWQQVQHELPNIAQYLQELQQLAQSEVSSIFHLVAKVLYQDKKVENFVQELGKFAGEVANDFLQAILNYEQGNISDLQQFIAWLDSAAVNLKSTQTEATSSVRVMTIHTAKGLQAPVVIIADAASSEQTPIEYFHWFGDKLYFSFNKEVVTPNIIAAKDKSKQLAREENRRLLYVALTRAEDELHIYGWPNNRDKDSWHNLLAHTHASLETTFYQEIYIDKKVINKLPVKNKSSSQALPDYLQRPQQNYTYQNTKLIRPSQKSKNAGSSSQNFSRGELIHKLLFILPYVEETQWQDVISSMVNLNSLALQLDDIYQVSTAVIQKFPHFFYAKNVFSEVSISAHIKGKLINAQIDKLIMEDELIKIIDFKTDVNPPSCLSEINPDYVRQMQLYKQIMVIKHPQKQILTQILWTENQDIATI